VNVERAAASASLIDVLDRILDKGIVIDAWVSVSLAGVAILAIEARIVVASIESWMRYAVVMSAAPPPGTAAERERREALLARRGG
jgi:hypothetical protein